MRIRGSILSALAFLLISFNAQLWATDVAGTARAVDEHYNQLRTFKSAFTETYQGPGVSRNEGGTVWLKKPGRMRWEYREPKEKLFITDSQNAYFYVAGERQARRTPLSKIDDIRSPLRYLLGKTKLEKELESLSLAPDITPIQPGDMILRGVPKAMKDRISEVILEISPTHEIVRIVIHGVDEAKTDSKRTCPSQTTCFVFSPLPGLPSLRITRLFND